MIIHIRKLTYLFLALALLLQACAPAVVEQQPEPVKLKVLLLPYLAHAPLFIAEEEGYFAEQGFQIEFVKMTRSAAAIPALAEGELDVMPASINLALLNAMARGANIKFVADMSHIAPTGCVSYGLMARRSLVDGGELDSLAQLKGRRISLNPASFGGYLVEKLLSTAGLGPDDVEIVDIPTPTKPEALEKGTIDLTVASEPWVTRILQAGHAVVWTPAQQVIPDFQIAVIVYGPTLLDENPDIGKRFMVAYLQAVRQYNQGKTERNLELLAEFTELDQELLMQACWPSFRNDGRINVQSMLDFQAWAVKKGYLDNPVTEEQFWDPSFVNYANQVLGTSSQ
jgi:ABC-type nitrate/sulfonate/bicarbonate transport system substrate-binding protein